MEIINCYCIQSYKVTRLQGWLFILSQHQECKKKLSLRTFWLLHRKRNKQTKKKWHRTTTTSVSDDRVNRPWLGWVLSLCILCSVWVGESSCWGHKWFYWVLFILLKIHSCVYSDTLGQINHISFHDWFMQDLINSIEIRSHLHRWWPASHWIKAKAVGAIIKTRKCNIK